jgi:hypothetical protein
MISPKLLPIGVTLSLLSLGTTTIGQTPPKPRTIELKVYRQSDPKESCPAKVLVTEKPRPYQEGSFSTDGSVNLSALATNISLLNRNNFSATWVGKLKPKYAKCSAAAGMTKVDGENYTGTINYLRMHFVQGKVYFFLDLAGAFDPNDYPLVVLKQSLKTGNPTWTWGGTD